MRVALIDDHKLFAESIKNILKDQVFITEIIIHFSGDDFFANLPVRSPDIIITDLLMPGEINGMKLIQMAGTAFAKCPKIIVLSTITDVQTIKQAIRMGASGYLSKEIAVEELFIAIKEVCDDRQYIAKVLQNALINSVFTEEQIVYHLSPREKEVLHNVCSGLTIKEIAYNLGLSTHTVQYYHKCVLSKLKLKRTSDLIVFAMQHGLYIPSLDKKD